MPHVTFIHGIANKPPAEKLLNMWLQCLAYDNGLDLGAEGVSSSMVYWADVLYESPKAESDFESSEEFESDATTPGKDEFDVDMSWRDRLKGGEANQIEALISKFNFDAKGPDEDYAPPEKEIGVGFEAVPLPWWLKRRLMKILLRDVHHYLFNAEHSPRPGQTFRVQDEIRRRVLNALQEGAQKPGRHVVMGHSMGTVIAYDCLKRVADCPKVDALMTIGGPLGLDEIQDMMKPEWSRENGYPGERVISSWANVFDKLDPVCGFDAKIANDYQREGNNIVKDINEQNWGKWRHNFSKYLYGKQLRTELRTMLDL